MKLIPLFIAVATLLGGCAHRNQPIQYLDRTNDGPESAGAADMQPYSGTTEIYSAAVPFEKIAVMLHPDYVLIGEAIYEDQGPASRAKLSTQAEAVGADAVFWRLYKPGWRPTPYELPPKPDDGFVTRFAPGVGWHASSDKHHAIFWRKRHAAATIPTELSAR